MFNFAHLVSVLFGYGINYTRRSCIMQENLVYEFKYFSMCFGLCQRHQKGRGFIDLNY
jgi:hypothetical protein